ncbi:MAG: STAS domain-containing protein [Rubrobacteraceae bacterium]
MDFDVSIEEHAEALSIIAVRGEVDLHTAPKVQYAIERASENSAAAVVVDMSGITFIDSTALSMLARAKKSLEVEDTSLRFVSPSPAVERIFSVTGFRDYFDIFPNRDEAVAAN